MRTIICRGKSRKTGEWVTGAYYETLGDHFIRDRGLEIEVEEDSVGEFTGCEDVNGVYIYEGDRVRDNHTGIEGRVTFERGMFGVKYNGASCGRFCSLARLMEFGNEVEVVGND